MIYDSVKAIYPVKCLCVGEAAKNKFSLVLLTQVTSRWQICFLYTQWLQGCGERLKIQTVTSQHVLCAYMVHRQTPICQRFCMRQHFQY